MVASSSKRGKFIMGKKEGGSEKERERNDGGTMVMVVLREITGFAGTRLSRRGCAKREREGKGGIQLDVNGGGKNGKERGGRGRERKDTGGRLCCMRAKRASAMAQLAGSEMVRGG